MKVVAADRRVAGIVTDVWVDRSEVVVRYLEIEIPTAEGARRVLAPMPAAKIDADRRRVTIDAILSTQFADVPGTGSDSQVTLLEEDKIAAYYARRPPLCHARAPGAPDMSGDYEFEPIPGLPEDLPAGETLLWQGSPNWKSLAVTALHIRGTAIYFAALLVWYFASKLTGGEDAYTVLAGGLRLGALALAALALMALYAWLSAKTTLYTITSRRVGDQGRRRAADGPQSAIRQDRVRRHPRACQRRAAISLSVCRPRIGSRTCFSGRMPSPGNWRAPGRCSVPCPMPRPRRRFWDARWRRHSRVRRSRPLNRIGKRAAFPPIARRTRQPWHRSIT